MGHDAVAAAEPLGAFAAHRDRPAGCAAEPLLHLIAMRGDHRPIADNRAIGIGELPAGFGEMGGNLSQHLDAVSTTPALIAVGKVRADIAKTSSAQHGIDYRMRNDICIAVAFQRLFTGKPDPAQHQRSLTAISAISKRMRVIPMPHPHRRPSPAVSSTHAS